MNTGPRNQPVRQRGTLLAVVSACWLLFLTALPLHAEVAAQAGDDTLTAELSIIPANDAVTSHEPSHTGTAKLNQHDLEPIPSTPAKASAQDLSLFGILALGIIGLLWVRRHTSEL